MDLLDLAINWLNLNRDKIKEIAISEIDYFAPTEEDNKSLSFGFETTWKVIQVIIWNEGYIKILRLIKINDESSITDLKISNPNELLAKLDNLIIEESKGLGNIK